MCNLQHVFACRAKLLTTTLNADTLLRFVRFIFLLIILTIFRLLQAVMHDMSSVRKNVNTF